MTSIRERLQINLTSSVKFLPANAALGFLAGYIYSRLADLPAVQAAKYWMVSWIAGDIIAQIAMSFSEEKVIKETLRFTTSVIVSGTFTYQMRKLELLGDKMMYAMIIYDIVASLMIMFVSLAILKREEVKNKIKNSEEWPIDYYSVFLVTFIDNLSGQKTFPPYEPLRLPQIDMKRRINPLRV